MSFDLQAYNEDIAYREAYIHWHDHITKNLPLPFQYLKLFRNEQEYAKARETWTKHLEHKYPFPVPRRSTFDTLKNLF